MNEFVLAKIKHRELSLSYCLYYEVGEPHNIMKMLSSVIVI